MLFIKFAYIFLDLSDNYHKLLYSIHYYLNASTEMLLETVPMNILWLGLYIDIVVMLIHVYMQEGKSYKWTFWDNTYFFVNLISFKTFENTHWNNALSMHIVSLDGAMWIDWLIFPITLSKVKLSKDHCGHCVKF